MTYYETLKSFLDEKGITAAELSRRTGLAKSLVTELKQGRSNGVTWENGILICDALGVSLDEFASRQRSGK